MNKYTKLITNTAVLALGTLGSKLLVFFLMPLYTRLLSSSEYSTADIITQTANLLIPLVSLGMYEAVFRFAMDKHRSKEEVLTTGLFMTLAGGAVFGIAVPFCSCIAYFDGYFVLIYIYVLTSSVHYLVSRYTRAIGKNTLFAVQGILATALNILFNIIFLIGFDMGVTGYVASVIVSDFLMIVFLFIALGLPGQIRLSRFNRELLAEMLKYSVPLIPTTVFWWVTNVSDRYIIKGVIGDATNGLYAAAFKIPTILLLLSSVFTEAWNFSAVVESVDGKQAHAEFFGRVFNSFQGLLFMSAAGLIAFSKLFASILFAPSYYEAWRYMPLLIVATVYSSLVTFMGSVYLVDKKSMMSFITAFIGALVNIGLNILLIKPLGANGAALATFVCYFIVYIIRAVTTKKLIPFDQHTVKVALNTAILLVQTVFMLFELRCWIIVQIAGIAAIFALNAGPILGGIGRLLKKLGKRA